MKIILVLIIFSLTGLSAYCQTQSAPAPTNNAEVSGQAASKDIKTEKKSKKSKKAKKAKKRRKAFKKECLQSPAVISAVNSCIKEKEDIWKKELDAKKLKKSLPPETPSVTPANN